MNMIIIYKPSSNIRRHNLNQMELLSGERATRLVAQGPRDRGSQPARPHGQPCICAKGNLTTTKQQKQPISRLLQITKYTEVLLLALFRKLQTDRSTDQPTDQQKDMRGHREDSLRTSTATLFLRIRPRRRRRSSRRTSSTSWSAISSHSTDLSRCFVCVCGLARGMCKYIYYMHSFA